MRRYLVAGTRHGLCNRLRVVLSAAALAEREHRELVVCWPTDGRFRAPLSALYLHPWREARSLQGTVGRYAQNALEKVTSPPTAAVTKKRPLRIVSTVQPFESDDAQKNQLSKLLPIPSISKTVASVASDLTGSGPLIGMHLRRREAHEKTIANSPPGWFAKRALEINCMLPSCRFFLSSDDEGASRELREMAPGLKIIEAPKDYQYNSSTGLQEAVCDLEILGRADYLLGSYWSSFSEIAALKQSVMAVEDSVNGPLGAPVEEILLKFHP